MTWAALAVRARGLGAHLLSEDALAAIERASDRDTLLAALAAAGVLVTSADPDAVEAAVRARAALDLATLARWDPSARALDAITLDEDRRSIRAIVRGIAAGVRAERRLEGALPTARLPDRVLTALAACATARELRDALGDHPLADAIEPSPRAGIASIDLFETELALARAYASRARVASNDH
ncbi:MAG TPA: V-type ATPase subunit, partial [Kofleriaceae bacterium]|nr:V-type ATPase subunit [Kofleriaceae bacterium]